MSISAPGGVSAPTDPSRVRFLAFLLDDLSRACASSRVVPGLVEIRDIAGSRRALALTVTI